MLIGWWKQEKWEGIGPKKERKRNHFQCLQVHHNFIVLKLKKLILFLIFVVGPVIHQQVKKQLSSQEDTNTSKLIWVIWWKFQHHQGTCTCPQLSCKIKKSRQWRAFIQGGLFSGKVKHAKLILRQVDRIMVGCYYDDLLNCCLWKILINWHVIVFDLKIHLTSA